MDNELLQAINELLREHLDPIKQELNKNSLLLENINSKVETMAELQESFQEQLERSKDKDGRTLADRLDIIEMAVTDTSSRVKDIHKELTRVVRTTAENWAEIVELKAVK